MKKQNLDIRRMSLWIAIGVLAILVIYVTFFKGSVDSDELTAGKTAGQVVYSEMVGGC